MVADDAGDAPDAMAREDGGRDAALDGGGPDGGPEPVTVRITRPTSPHYTSGASVSIQVFVEGGEPERVDLELDGVPLLMLAPPYTYELELDDLDEATHEVVAVARVDGAPYESEPLLVVVDRTAPTVIERHPAAGVPYEAGASLEVVFSEPMDPATIDETSAPVVNGVGEPFVADRELSEDGTTLTITLRDGPPSAAGSIVAQFGSMVRDRAGVGLVPVEVSWTMPMWIPDEPPLVIPAATAEWGSVNGPIARRAPSGGTYVAARTYDGTVARIVVYLRTLGGWERIVGDGCGALETARWDFALSPSGEPHIVRTYETATHWAASVCRWDGSTWQQIGGELRLSDASEFPPSDVALAFGSGGDLAVAVQLSDSAAVYRSIGGSTWRAALSTAPVGGQSLSLLASGPAYLTAGLVSSSGDTSRWDLHRWAPDAAGTLVPTFDTSVGVARPFGNTTGFSIGDPVFRIGCEIVRQIVGETGLEWVSTPAPTSDVIQCAATPSPGGQIFLVSHVRSTSTVQLAAQIEVPGGGAVQNFGVAAAPIMTLGGIVTEPLSVAVDDRGRPLVFFGGTLPSGETGIGAVRLNLLWGLP